MLTDRDRKLLSELGLDSCDSIDDYQRRISQLTMRQLDRLKLMLNRILLREAKVSQKKFPSKTRKGIAENDLQTFAKAILLLISASDDNKSKR